LHSVTADPTAITTVIVVFEQFFWFKTASLARYIIRSALTRSLPTEATWTTGERGRWRVCRTIAVVVATVAHVECSLKNRGVVVIAIVATANHWKPLITVTV